MVQFLSRRLINPTMGKTGCNHEKEPPLKKDGSKHSLPLLFGKRVTKKLLAYSA